MRRPVVACPTEERAPVRARLRFPRSARRAAAVGVLAASALVAGAAPAQAATALTYSCEFPFGAQPVSVTIDTTLAGAFLPIDINRRPSAYAAAAKVTLGSETVGALRSIGVASIDGQMSVGFSITQVAARSPSSEMTFPNQPLTEGEVSFRAEGSLTPSELWPGTGTLSVASLRLNWIGRTADGAVIPAVPATPDAPATSSTFASECTLSPSTQDTLLGSLSAGYVSSGPTPTPTPSPTLPPTPTPIAPPSPTATPTSTPVPTPTPLPCEPGDPCFGYSYSVTGSATLKTLVKGSLPLKGALRSKVSVADGRLSGDVSLDRTSGTLIAYGFLPVVAQLQLVPTEPIAGALKGGTLKASAKLRVKLPKVTLFGIELAGGTACQARQISSVALQSTQPVFSPVEGGPIAGTFAISDLSGCGALTGIVSPLTKGTGNALLLNLKHESTTNPPAPPTAPGAPTVSEITPSSAKVTWGASSDDHGIVGYDVYDEGVLIAATTGPETSTTLAGLDATKNPFYITVKARDIDGLLSPPSDRVTFSLPVPPPPPKPILFGCGAEKRQLVWIVLTLKDADFGVLLPSTKRFAVEAKIWPVGSFLSTPAATIQGGLTLKSTFSRAGATLPVHVPLVIQNRPVTPQPWIATGQSPVITIPGSAQLQWRLDGIALNLSPRLADGTPSTNSPWWMPPLATDEDPGTYDVTCSLTPSSQDTLIYPTQPFSVIEN